MSTRSSTASSDRPAAESGRAAAEIQSCGFLVAVGHDWRVLHVSANIGEHFADCGGLMAGQPLTEYFGGEAVHALRNQLTLLRDPRASARLFSLVLAGVPRPFDLVMHNAGDAILLEALPATHHETPDTAGSVRAMASLLDAFDDAEKLLAAGAHGLRAMTGFDRVTIFRTGGEGSDVVAHDARGSLPPAGACPEPVLRMIADGQAKAVALGPGAGQGLTGRALLRSCSAAEQAALAADGANACLTLPMRSAGRDWGVAACLNPTPRRPILGRIAAAELFVDLLAIRAELCELRR